MDGKDAKVNIASLQPNDLPEIKTLSDGYAVYRNGQLLYSLRRDKDSIWNKLIPLGPYEVYYGQISPQGFWYKLYTIDHTCLQYYYDETRGPNTIYLSYFNGYLGRSGVYAGRVISIHVHTPTKRIHQEYQFINDTLFGPYRDTLDIKQGVEGPRIETAPVLKPLANNIAPKVEPERFVVILNSTIGFLNGFIGYLYGDYTAPYSYYESISGILIVYGPLYGQVQLRTTDRLLYVSYTTNDDNILIGEFHRSPYIPFMEQAAEFEYIEKTPSGVEYLSFYDPGGSGQLISYEDYNNYLIQTRQYLTGIFPVVLTNITTGYLT